MGNSDRLDNLLIAWHRSEETGGPALGYPKECPSCHGGSFTKQWSGTDVDEHGDVYLDAPDPMVSGTGRLIGDMIATLEVDYQRALAYEARALAIGSYAFRNPRLPSDVARLSLLVTEARGALVILLGDLLCEDD